MTRLLVLLSLLLMNFYAAQAQDSKKQSAALQIIKSKCADCHSSQGKLPFYADFPVARDIISQDIANAQAHWKFKDELSSDKFSETFLAKLEWVLNDGSMPPFRYTALHWDKVIKDNEKTLLLEWINEYRDGSVIKALPSKEEVLQSLNADKVELGDALYHDTRLSGDNTISCASCHDLAKGGTDQSQYSTGINGTVGHINSPTTFNSSYNFKQFWDGRAASLEDQARGPVHNPAEMGSDWEEVIGKLSKDASYIQQFKAIYGGSEPINGENIVDAIAEFERSLVNSDSAFDKYLSGAEDAISDEAKAGYETFKKIGCASCHNGPALGGSSFQKMGHKIDSYFSDRENRGLKISKEDYGRFNVTQKESDKFKFKVPTLRNIVDTAPYYHDGSIESLEEAVKLMAKYQLGKSLSQTEVNNIVSFLNTLK